MQARTWRTAGAGLALAVILAAGAPNAGARTVPAVEAVPAEALEEAIERGVQFLLETQNRNGSWGSPTRTKGLNVYAPVPGAHHAFRAAVTAMCVAALIELEPERTEVLTALDRAEAWLLQELPRVRRAEGSAIYNVWSHAYGIRALVRMLERHAGDGEQRALIREVLEGQIDRLQRYEFLHGGWGYYDFEARTQRPSGSPNSFTTATVLVALHEAAELGIEAPQRLVDRAIATVQRQRNPDNTYLYSENFHFARAREINLPPGSLARSQVCNLALRMWGDESIDDEVIELWLQRLFARNGWLDMARKRPVPHESWYLVAGYFFYYGHYYAAHCIELLPEQRREPYRHHMARALLALQESDGSWWDFPFYNYHQPYGTAFALMTLHRCRAP